MEAAQFVLKLKGINSGTCTVWPECIELCFDTAGNPSTTEYEDVMGGDPGGCSDRLAEMTAAGHLPPLEGPKALATEGGDEEDQLAPDQTYT